MMKKLLLIFMCALIVLCTGCSSNSEVLQGGIENNGSTMLSMSYDKFTGYRETSIQVFENSTVTVRIDIVTEGGSLDAFITTDSDADDRVYEGHKIPTSSFTVNLKEPGKYTLRVDAQNHVGSYSFSWD